LIAAIAGAIFLAAGCKRAGPPQGAQGFPPVLVTTTEVVTRDVPIYLDEIGKCAANKSVAVKPQVSGKIVKINFVDGADVKKDDVLFEIDPAPYQAALDQAKAQLAQSRAQLAFAKVDFNRIKDLPRSVEPQSDYDAKQSAIDVAQAQVEAADAAIAAAQVNLAYCKIKADIDGLAGQRMVDEGNVVIANNPMGASATTLTIQQLDPIYADFTVTESDLAAVRANMARGTLKTLVRLPADKEPREGTLSFLDNSVLDGAGTVKLRATLPNKDRHFWPGQFVFARLVLDVKKDATLVPASAVQVGQQGPYVYIVKSDSSAELRPVVQGQTQGDLIVIQQGIEAGEKVVVTGQMMIMPGGKVRELPPPPAAQAMDPSAPPKKSAAAQPAASAGGHE
jgi:multidrug efflux system membrane fusion protein